ncbi:MAG: FtsX-like permease family protein [Bryobacteraceae bacterium]
MTKPSEWSAAPPRYWNIVGRLIGFGRLKQGVSLERASAELNVVSHQYAISHPDRNEGGRMRLVWMKDRLVANVRLTLWILFGVVAFVLLIACANVAGLLLARASSRSREFAVRMALGAPRGRLIRQLLAESIVFSVIGGSLGLLLAKWALTAVKNISALNLAGIGEIRLDGAVLAFTVALSILTGILFGLFPSLQISRPYLADELRESGATAGHSSTVRPRLFAVSTRGLLVVAQIAFSIVLLIGATLLMRSFARLRNVDPGFQPANLLTAKVVLPPLRYDTAQKKLSFFGDLTRRLETIPGVRSAAIAMSLPTTSWLRTNMQIQGQPWEEDPAKWPSVQIQSVTPGYFRTLGISIERGQEFTGRDNSFGAPPVMMINESFARQFWPTYPLGQNPVGQHVREGADKTSWVEIIGIAANVHEGGLAMEALPEFYVPCIIHPPQTAWRCAQEAIRIAS